MGLDGGRLSGDTMIGMIEPELCWCRETVVPLTVADGQPFFGGRAELFATDSAS